MGGMEGLEGCVKSLFQWLMVALGIAFLVAIVYYDYQADKLAKEQVILIEQQADKKIEMGQELILTKKTRDWKDWIIVTEKIDGSNVGVVRKNGLLQPISRAGYNVMTSPYKQHHMFLEYVNIKWGNLKKAASKIESHPKNN